MDFIAIDTWYTTDISRAHPVEKPRAASFRVSMRIYIKNAYGSES